MSLFSISFIFQGKHYVQLVTINDRTIRECIEGFDTVGLFQIIFDKAVKDHIDQNHNTSNCELEGRCNACTGHSDGMEYVQFCTINRLI